MIIQGDNGIIIPFVAKKGAILNLEGAIVEVSVKRSNELLTKVATITNAEKGECEFELLNSDLTAVGLYEWQWTAIYEDGKILAGKTKKILVSKKLTSGGSIPTNPTESLELTIIKNEINQAKGSFKTLADKLNSIVIEGGGTPSNVILFDNWVEGESVIIGDTPTPPGDTTAPILTISQGGNFTGTKSVTMSVNETATIYYTLDGSTPNVNSSVYTVPLSVSATTTLKAFARDTAGNNSAIQTIIYTLVVPNPGDTTAPSNVTNLQVTNNTTGTGLTLNWTASISNDVVGYEIYRGSTLLSTVTGTSYNVTGLTTNTEYTFTIKAKDTSNNIASGTSVTVTATYVDNVAPILTITPSGTFTDTKTVTMTTNETAAIYYTLDGTEPNESSLVYSIPLTLTETTTVKAFAKDTSSNASTVQTINYTKQEAPIEFEGTQNAFIQDSYMYVNPLTILDTDIVIRAGEESHKYFTFNGFLNSVNKALSINGSGVDMTNIFNGVIPYAGNHLVIADFTNGNLNVPSICYITYGSTVYIRIPNNLYVSNGSSVQASLFSISERLPVLNATANETFVITDSIIDSLVSINSVVSSEGFWTGFVTLPGALGAHTTITSGLSSISGRFSSTVLNREMFFVNASTRLNFRIPQEKMTTTPTLPILKQYLKDNRLTFWIAM